MRICVHVFSAVLVVGAAALAGDEGKERKLPQQPLDPFMLYSPDANTLRVVPLRHGQLPDLTVGTLLRPSCGRGVDPQRPVQGFMLHEGAILALRHGKEPGYSRFEHSQAGRWRETAVDVWPRNWHCAATADLTGDDRDDLLLVRRMRAQGHSEFRCMIAKGRQNGTFDFSGAQLVIYPNTWFATFTLGDVNSDGKPDLVFHQIPHGGSAPLTVEFLAGRGDGSFDPPEQRQVLLKAREAANNLVLADFNRDRVLDLFLPPDDDVPDFGQAHLALSQPKGARAYAPSLDLRPTKEHWGTDNGSFQGVATDVDLDGQLDIVARFSSWDGSRRYTYQVFRGHADGSFGSAESMAGGTPDPGAFAPQFGWIPGW